MPSILITGANRGLGLAFAKQYAAAGWRVYAACRAPDDAATLNAVAATTGGQVSVHGLDIGDGGSVAALAAILGYEPLDVLLNNAGIYLGKQQGFGETDYDEWQETLRINTLAPLRMVEALIDNVTASERKQLVFISSKMGSMADNVHSGGAYLYRSSKAALNAVVRSLTVDLAGRGVTVVAFHPGWVSTDMGGHEAPVTPAASVHGMREVIERLKPADSGRFLDHQGAEVPW
ncbi:MAG: SDR family oxidoreductase [Alphaproteobacteria bacterium]|nr:SDR family oxidoreductase [Alphaproteobacteria bacterium]